jgi:hypothetical protein
VEDLGSGVHNLAAAGHTVKCYLANTAPSASLDAVKADLAEIAGGNGYTAGGHDTQQDFAQTTGTATMTAVDIVITAAGGTVGPFQYVVCYNDTPTSPADPLISWWDYGSAITLQIGETFTIDFTGNAIFTLA